MGLNDTHRIRSIGIATALVATVGMLELPVAHGQAPAAVGDIRVVVVPPDLQGTFAPDARGRIRDGISSGIGRSDGSGIETETVCAQSDCAQSLAESLDASHVFVSQIVAENRDYLVRLRLYDARGEIVAEADEECEICGLEEVAELVSSKAAQLVTGLEQDATGVVLISSTPSGAKVYVDDEAVGETPLELSLPAGQHDVRIEKAGFNRASRNVSVSPGVKTSAAIDLVPAPRRRTTVWGGVALGTGVVLLGGAVGLLAVDGREYGRRCDGQDVDIDGDCRFVVETKWAGAALAIAGTAAATVGISLLVTERRRVRNAHVRAALTPTGVSVSGRF